MSRRALGSVLVVAAIACMPGTAWADILISPPNPLNQHCTPEEQCPTGALCEYGRSHDRPQADWEKAGADCRAAAKAKGWERRCRDGGNYGGHELYCPPGATGSWSPESNRPASVPDSVEAPGAEATKTSPPQDAGPATLPPEPPRSTTNSCAVGNAGLGAVWLVLAFALLRRRRP